jgi:pimeloyl-ACP methyl ester carboxylesterase
VTGMHVTANGVPLWVEQRGAGPDLVLLCGLGDTHQAWAHQLQSLAGRFRLTAIDNRGVGRSGLPDGEFTVADMAADAAGVLDALGIARAHVAGFSMGGAIAQELAIARPDLVRSLVLVGTWCRTDAHLRRLFDSWAWMAERAESDEAFVRALFLWVYTRRAHLDGAVDTWVAQALADEHPQSTDAFVRTIEAIKAHDTADRLRDVTGPKLIVAGDQDLICPPSVQQELAEHLTDCEVSLLAGEAHQPFQEAPERFDRVVLDFLDEVS